MSLPLQLPWSTAQTRWKSQLDPLIVNPMVNGQMLTGITLAANTPLAINTLLSRVQQGWVVVDNSASCTVWRTQPFNSSTLTLEASANTTISLWVF